MNHRHTRLDAARGERGFTLIEMMVTIAVLAILMAIAYPNLQGLVNGQRLSGTANEIIAGLQIARTEAVRRNARVALCASSDGSTCDTGSTTWAGWAILADSNADGTPDELVQAGQFRTPVQVKTGYAGNATTTAITNNTVLFRADGLARAGTGSTAALLTGAVNVCVPKKRPTDNQRVITVSSGSTITTTAAGTGAGTCP